ncbi:hypothetical protein ACQY0O_008186 [Thecaphora frezii]
MSLQPLAPDLQESVLKARMQIDERPLRRLIKKLTTLLTSPSHRALHLCAFQAEVTSFLTALQRLHSVSSSTLPLEASLYASELASIQAAQRRARAEIGEWKQTLASAKLERRQKLDYDGVASELAALPPRAELEESLQKLTTTLDGVREERENLEGVASDAQQRVEAVAGLLESLVREVGEEVGRRERREVQRDEAEGEAEEADGDRDADEDGDVDGDAEADEATTHHASTDTHAAAAAAGTSTATTAIPRSKSRLNASAPAFLPPPLASKREPASDEEGQVPETPIRDKAKRIKTQSQPHPQPAAAANNEAGDSEEEEGSILPPAAPAMAAATMGGKRPGAPPGERRGDSLYLYCDFLPDDLGAVSLAIASFSTASERSDTTFENANASRDGSTWGVGGVEIRMRYTV